jgi:hypothetical protein
VVGLTRHWNWRAALSEEKAPPGWYAYGDSGEERYWDGEAWAEQRREPSVAVATESEATASDPSGPPMPRIRADARQGGERGHDGRGQHGHQG